jgi:uncharacterized surface protein with fasciclin (FAS1) repeats
MKQTMFTRIAVAAVAAVMFAVPAYAEDAAPKKDAEKNIVETAVAAGKFNTLVKLVKAADLAETLSGPGPFTVFAPTDEAFAKVDEKTVQSLLEPANKQKLADILKYHVVSGKVMAEDAKKLDGKSAKTVQGGEIKISVADGKVKINDATVVKADIGATNGVIHVIDAVIMPPAADAAAK